MIELPVVSQGGGHLCFPFHFVDISFSPPICTAHTGVYGIQAPDVGADDMQKRPLQSRSTAMLISSLLCSSSAPGTKLNVCITDRDANDFILVQKDKWFCSEQDPHAQLVARPIAAFQNNKARRLLAGLDPLTRKVLCIVSLCVLPGPLFTLDLGHSRCNHGRDISEFLEDPSHPRTEIWTIPTYSHHCHWACPCCPGSQS
jgi:hypothetical protein